MVSIDCSTARRLVSTSSVGFIFIGEVVVGATGSQIPLWDNVRPQMSGKRATSMSAFTPCTFTCILSAVCSRSSRIVPFDCGKRSPRLPFTAALRSASRQPAGRDAFDGILHLNLQHQLAAAPQVQDPDGYFSQQVLLQLRAIRFRETDHCRKYKEGSSQRSRPSLPSSFVLHGAS